MKVWNHAERIETEPTCPLCKAAPEVQYGQKVTMKKDLGESKPWVIEVNVGQPLLTFEDSRDYTHAVIHLLNNIGGGFFACEVESFKVEPETEPVKAELKTEQQSATASENQVAAIIKSRVEESKRWTLSSLIGFLGRRP